MNVYRFIGNVYNSADSQKGEIMRTIILSLIMMLISFPALAVKSSPVDTGNFISHFRLNLIEIGIHIGKIQAIVESLSI